jgi:hypothetical protein
LQSGHKPSRPSSEGKKKKLALREVGIVIVYWHFVGMWRGSRLPRMGQQVQWCSEGTHGSKHIEKQAKPGSVQQFIVFQVSQYRGDGFGCFISLAASLDGAVGVPSRCSDAVGIQGPKAIWKG